MRVTPHVAQKANGRRSAIDRRTTRHGGYLVSQRIRKRNEEAFGWIKTVAGQEKMKLRGRDRVGWAFTFQRRRLQSDAAAETHRGADMTAPAGCQLIGRWRIVEADLWDRDYLDLVAPATIVIGADNHGEIAFGAMQPASTLNTVHSWSSSHGPASMKWTKSPATAPPNCSMTGPSRSRSPTTTATKPSSRPYGILLQQPVWTIRASFVVASEP